MLQNCSNGPPAHVPSFTESLSGGVFGLQVASEQSLGLVTLPGREQALDGGHSVPVVQTAPALVPLRHRLPPHTTPAAQSAFVEHAAAPASPQVSQKQLSAVNPGAVQSGLAAAKVSVCRPVVRCSLMLSAAMFAAGSGGQSKLAEATRLHADANPHVIEAHGLTKRFGDFTAAQDITFEKFARSLVAHVAAYSGKIDKL